MGAADDIRERRVGAGLTQYELARRSGLRQPNVAAYENGTRRPSPAMLARLMAAARALPSVVVRQRRSDILAIAEANKAGDVRVFGSVARGDDTPDSDIDLLVTFGPTATIFDQARLVAELEEALGLHVDVVSERALKPRDTAIRNQAVPL